MLIRDGEIDERMMRRHRITSQALRAALHQSGYESAAEIRVFVEPDGDISFLAART